MRYDLQALAGHCFEASTDATMSSTARIACDRLARALEWLAGVRYTKAELES